jgi:hypothetical protein
MEFVEFGGYAVEYDRSATVAAYARVSRAGADICTRDSCDNFAHQRATVYPEQFAAILRLLGIDPLKEREAYECGKDGTGLYLYGGWLHFVGTVVRVGDEIDLDGFKYWFDRPGNVPKPDDAFSGGPVSAIEFLTHLPWVSDKPAPN